MTEKEILMNMIKRVAKKYNSPETFWAEKENGDFSIFNGSAIETCFEFDEEGNLIWYY